MISWFYNILGKIGYAHPVHPILVHFTVGLTLATLVFALIGWLGKRPVFFTTARHTINFAIVAYVLTVLFGFADWIHFYGKAWILPVKMKILFASILLPLLVAAYFLNRREGANKIVLVIIYALAGAVVVVIAYFGANLVY